MLINLSQLFFPLFQQKHIRKHNPIHQEALIDTHSFPKTNSRIMILYNIKQINRQIDGLLKIEILFQNVMNEKEKLFPMSCILKRYYKT